MFLKRRRLKLFERSNLTSKSSTTLRRVPDDKKITASKGWDKSS